MNIDAELNIEYKQYDAAVHPAISGATERRPLICLPWKDTGANDVCRDSRERP